MTRQEEMRQEMNRQCSNYRERIGFRKGFEEADRTMIERASQWLQDNIESYINPIGYGRMLDKGKLIDDFKKAMQNEHN